MYKSAASANRATDQFSIDQRADKMLQGGLEKEVRELLRREIPRDTTAMQAIGGDWVIST